jgi:hypothetical protein
VTKGIRNRGQTLLEAAVWNTTDAATATDTLATFLTRAMEETGSSRQ